MTDHAWDDVPSKTNWIIEEERKHVAAPGLDCQVDADGRAGNDERERRRLS